MPSSTTIRNAVAQMMGITGASERVASSVLKKHNYKLDAACDAGGYDDDWGYTMTRGSYDDDCRHIENRGNYDCDCRNIDKWGNHDYDSTLSTERNHDNGTG
ncbi:hypothetical protein V500_09916 [Pseudogymnoascus sp. VKM F-4518 (FW-2643)]|nr:hypothetical protein V500_09916 [Pseudogymnoascus sp. VKM F-4518 (FW-2643)]